MSRERPAVFTSEELIKMREALAEFRTDASYSPDRWMVSKYQRDPRVVQAILPKAIKLRDITLRTAEQMPGVFIAPEDRARYLAEVTKAGVASIETSGFGRGHTVADMRREAKIVKTLNAGCELVYAHVRSEDDIKMASETGYDAVGLSLAYLSDAQPSCAGAVYHRAWQGRDWRNLNLPQQPSDQVSRAQRFVELGLRYGVTVVAGINLLALADEDYVAMYAKGIAEAGGTTIFLADGSSGAGPEVFAHLVRIARAAAPSLEIGVHSHDGFGLGLACSIEAVKAGCDTIEVAVNGCEEHAGNPDLACTAVALEAMYGVSTGIDLSMLVPLARLTEEITGYSVGWNHPITGPAVFDMNGDEYYQERHVDRLIHSSLTPEAVGATDTLKIGLRSGPFMMWDKLTELGFEDFSTVDCEKVLARCKDEIRATRRELSDVDIRTLAAGYLSSES